MASEPIAKPKLAFIGPLQPYRGGVAQYTTQLHKALSEQSQLKTISFKRLYPAWLYPGKTDKESDNDTWLPEVDYLIDAYHPRSLRKTADSIVASGCEVAIITWWTLIWQPGLAYLARRLRKQGVKTVFLCHNLFDHDAKGLKRSLSEKFLKQADAYIVHSTDEKTLLADIKPKAPVLQRILPIYSHYPKAIQQLPKRGRLELLFYGFIRPYKGLNILVDALAELKDKQIYITIAGEPWSDAKTLRQQLLAKQIPNLELYLEYVHEKETASYFDRADIIVLPYISATGSAVLSVAYNYHKPVLATRVGGLADGVIEGKTGWLVEPNSPSQLASKIAGLTRSQAQATAPTIENFCKENSWQAFAKAVCEFAAKVN